MNNNRIKKIAVKPKRVAKKPKKNIEAEIKKANDTAAADPKYHGKSKLEVKANEVILALIGALAGAFATVNIMIPCGLTYGGITGIARMIQNYTGWNYSLTYYGLTAVIMIIVALTLGFREIRKIVLLSVVYPGMMLVLEALNFSLLDGEDKLLAAVFCGVAFGVSNGLTFKAGYSSGGTDSLAKVIKYKKLQHIGINDITFVINTTIVIISAFVFGIEIALYAIVTMYVSMKVGEVVMFGSNVKLVQLDVITDAPNELSDYVMNSLGRGVTSVAKTGEYTGEERKHLQVLCSPRESFLIKRFLAEHDPKAFVTVLQVSSVWGVGRGFSDINEMEQ